MVQNEITFENLPKAVAHLVSEVAEIKNLVCKGQTPIVPLKRIPIGIDDARPLQNLTPFSIILVFELYWLTCSLYF